MEFQWSFFVDVGIVSVALLLATLIRSRVRFFQRFLIPNALTAGFLLLPFYNFLAPLMSLQSEGLGEIVYHLLSISFIAMTLRRPKSVRGKSDRGVIATSVAVVFQFGLQGFLGLLLTFVLMRTIVPGLFPSFGLFVPLGFAMGPGQAYAIGASWEVFGFEGASSVGLTFAALGFLLACFAGVYMINYGFRKGWASPATMKAAEKEEPAVRNTQLTGIVPAGDEGLVGARLRTFSDAIDSMSVSIGIVLSIYFITFLLLKLLTFLLGFAGELGTDLAANLWGISFVFSMIMAVVARKLLHLARWDHVLDQGSLTRISGTSVDLMVAAAVGAISLVVVADYWLPLVIIGGVASLAVYLTVPWMASRLFTSYRFQRTVIIFGAMTGTLPTGLAMLRVLDPEFKTPVAGDYVYSAAVIFVVMIPMILAMNLPAYSVTRDQPALFWITMLMLAGYMVVSLVLYKIIARKRAFHKPGRFWMPRPGEQEDQ